MGQSCLTRLTQTNPKTIKPVRCYLMGRSSEPVGQRAICFPTILASKRARLSPAQKNPSNCVGMAAMGAEDGRTNRKKQKKKARKDKWGQPVVSETAVEEEPEEEQQHEGGSVGDRRHRRSSEEQMESYELNKLVVSGMPYSTTEDQIRDLFKDVGPVLKLQLSRFPDSGNFRGLAFVTFETEAIAASSLKLDGIKMGDRFLKVERCRLDPQRKRKSEFLSEPTKVDGCFSAYVGNLSWDVTEDDIRDCFEDSKITSVRFALDKRTGNSRGFCHVDFEDDESVENAVKKNQAELNGRPMKIAYAVSNRH